MHYYVDDNSIFNNILYKINIVSYLLYILIISKKLKVVLN